jgi:hypothetical protein
MVARASRCVDLLGPSLRLDALTPRHAAELLTGLRGLGKLTDRSVLDYYSTCRRMLRLAGFAEDWPPGGHLDKRRPKALPLGDFHRVAEWLEAKGWRETADLVGLIAGTGLRCDVEALTPGCLTCERGDDYDTLSVGGRYSRAVPVVDGRARAILRAPERLQALQAHSHSGHLKRLRKAVLGLAMGQSAATFVAIRRAFGVEVYQRSGGNRQMVRELLGLASPR